MTTKGNEPTVYLQSVYWDPVSPRLTASPQPHIQSSTSPMMLLTELCHHLWLPAVSHINSIRSMLQLNTETESLISGRTVIEVILYKNEKYILSNSESVQRDFFIFDHVTFIQFKICCCVQNFIEIGWFFAEIWRYIDFKNGNHLPFGIVLPLYETTHEVSVAGRSCLSNFMSIWYTYIWLKMPIQGPKMGVLGDFGTLNVIIHHRDTQKAHPCINPRLLSYQL